MENELVLFEQQNVALFKQLAEFKKLVTDIEEKEKQVKENLEKSMLEYNIKSFKNDIITISYVDASESISIDLKKLQEKEPDLYNELLEDYKKVTVKKPYVRMVVK